MKLLHPIMPFITEEIYQLLAERTEKDSICMASYPQPASYDETLLFEADLAIEIIAGIREVRGKAQKKNHETVDVSYSGTDAVSFHRFSGKIIKLARIAKWESVNADMQGVKTAVIKGYKFFIETGEPANAEGEKEKLLKELDYAKGFLASIEKKLANEKFVSNAPAQVLETGRIRKKMMHLKNSYDRANVRCLA